VLERLAMGVLPAERETTSKAHLDGCESCRNRFEAFRREQQDFHAQTQHTPEVFARRVLARVERQAEEQAPRRSWSWLTAFLVPAAALAVLLLLKPPRGPDDYIGVKGAVSLFVRLRAEGTPKLTDGALVHPNDEIRFSYSAPQAGEVLVVGLNERGEVFPYYPLQGTASASAVAGNDVMLDGSVVLDDTLGHERFYLLFTERPIQVSDVRAAVEAAHTSWKSVELPLHAQQASLLLEKVAR
jgi:hypothetical protein